MPPVKAETLCSSPPFDRATSPAAFFTRSLIGAIGKDLRRVARISDADVNDAWEVAYRARYIGKRDKGMRADALNSSCSAS